MIYSYKCPHCKIEVEINKTMEEVDRIEHCHVCESVMQRVWQAPMISTGDGIKK